MKTLILILALTFTTFGQVTIDQIKAKSKTAPFKKVKYYGIGYDKFTDKSIVSFANVFGGKAGFLMGGSILSFIAEFRFDGQTLNKSIDEFTIGIAGYGKSPQFLKEPHLYIIADNARFDLTPIDSDLSVKSNPITGTMLTERLDFKISRRDLETIANAKSVEVKVSDAIFTVKPEILSGVKSILAFGTL